MMHRGTFAAALLLAAAGGVKFETDYAKATGMARGTGEAVAVYYVIDSKGNSIRGDIQDNIDKGFSDEELVRISKDKVIFVKGDAKMAKDNNVHEVPYLDVVDPDGETLFHSPVGSPGDISKVVEKAMEKWVPVEVPWGSDIASAVESAKGEGKLVAVLFHDPKADPKKDKMALLEETLKHPYVAKLHAKVAWVKVDFDKDSEAARKYVVGSPGLVAIDPVRDKNLNKQKDPMGVAQSRQWIETYAAKCLQSAREK